MWLEQCRNGGCRGCQTVHAYTKRKAHTGGKLFNTTTDEVRIEKGQLLHFTEPNYQLEPHKAVAEVSKIGNL